MQTKLDTKHPFSGRAKKWALFRNIILETVKSGTRFTKTSSVKTRHYSNVIFKDTALKTAIPSTEKLRHTQHQS